MIIDKQPYKRTIRAENQSAFGYMRRQIWTHPAVASATKFKTAQATSGSVITTVTTFSAQPDFPRPVSIDPGGTTADVPSGDVTITGTDIRDNVISDVITFAANATAAKSTLKAFKTITSIVFPIQDGGSATYDVGTDAYLGLDRCMTADEVLQGTVDGAIEATRPVGTAHATDVSKNLVTFSTTLDATKVFRAVYIATEKTGSNKTTA